MLKLLILEAAAKEEYKQISLQTKTSWWWRNGTDSYASPDLPKCRSSQCFKFTNSLFTAWGKATYGSTFSSEARCCNTSGSCAIKWNKWPWVSEVSSAQLTQRRISCRSTLQMHRETHTATENSPTTLNTSEMITILLSRINIHSPCVAVAHPVQSCSRLREVPNATWVVEYWSDKLWGQSRELQGLGGVSSQLYQRPTFC